MKTKPILNIALLIFVALIILNQASAADCKIMWYGCDIANKPAACGDKCNGWEKITSCTYQLSLTGQGLCKNVCSATDDCCKDYCQGKYCTQAEITAGTCTVKGDTSKGDIPSTACILTNSSDGKCYCYADLAASCYTSKATGCVDGVCCSTTSCKTGSCDADNDGRSCGHYSCAGGKSTEKQTKDDVAAGTCGCINDNPTKYYDYGEFVTKEIRTPASIKTSLYSIETEYNYSANTYFNVSYKVSGSSSYSTPAKISSAGVPIFVYDDPKVFTNSVNIKYYLFTTDDSKTPEIHRLKLKTFPVLNSGGGAVITQYPARTRCAPVVNKTVTCDLSGFTFKTCSGSNISEVSGILNEYTYKEINLLDNRQLLDTSTCLSDYPIPAQKAEGIQCVDNSECSGGCCVGPTLVTPGTCTGTLDLSKPSDANGNYLNEFNQVCGLAISSSCSENDECASLCCSVKTSTCCKREAPGKLYCAAVPADLSDTCVI